MPSTVHGVVLACLLGPAIAQTFAPIARPPHVGNPSAFDTARQRLVMLGDDGTTWELAGSELLPRANWTGAPTPTPLLDTSLCYDQARRRVLRFGGIGVSASGILTLRNDTCAYDGSGWTQLTGGPVPPARSRAMLVWDATRNRAVMWGGFDVVANALYDTWEHDGNGWLQRSPATSPSGGSSSMVFDSQRSVAVLATRTIPGMPIFTWEWDGTNWAFRTTMSVGGLNGDQTMAFDPLRNRTVLVGPDDNIREWDGTTWSTFPLPQAYRRTKAASWFDPSCGCVTFAGGNDSLTGRNRADLWRWNGQALTQVQPDAGPRATPGVMFADPPRGRVVHFGGAIGFSSTAETWALVNGVWSAVPSLASPSARTDSAATHDLLRGESLLFGGWGVGGLLGDTWSLGSAGWVARSTTGPPPRLDAAMAADLVRGVVVLFGGTEFGPALDDTWEWNGTLWTRRATTVQPTRRAAAAMAFHPQLGKLLLFGGIANGVGLNDTWTWDGSQWTQLSPATVPPALQSPSMGSDLLNSRCTLIGATGAQPLMRQQVWAHDGTDWQVVLNVPAPITGFFTPCAASAGLDSMVCARFDSPAAAAALTMTPGRVATIGAGCGTPASTLLVRSRPRIGTTTGLELVANPGRAVLFALDPASGSTPVSGGCTVWLSPTFLGLFQSSNTSGFAEQLLLVPANPGLRGLDLFAQAAVLEPQSSNGLVLTQGLRLTLGD